MLTHPLPASNPPLPMVDPCLTWMATEARQHTPHNAGPLAPLPSHGQAVVPKTSPRWRHRHDDGGGGPCGRWLPHGAPRGWRGCAGGTGKQTHVQHSSRDWPPNSNIAAPHWARRRKFGGRRFQSHSVRFHGLIFRRSLETSPGGPLLRHDGGRCPQRPQHQPVAMLRSAREGSARRRATSGGWHARPVTHSLPH